MDSGHALIHVYPSVGSEMVLYAPAVAARRMTKVKINQPLRSRRFMACLRYQVQRSRHVAFRSISSLLHVVPLLGCPPSLLSTSR